MRCLFCIRASFISFAMEEWVRTLSAALRSSSIFSFHLSKRAIISSWFDNPDGSSAFFTSRLNLLEHKVMFSKVESPPTLRGTVCSISYLGLGPMKSANPICSPVYRHTCPCSSHNWNFKISTSVGTISLPVSSLYNFTMSAAYPARAFSLSLFHLAMA